LFSSKELEFIEFISTWFSQCQRREFGARFSVMSTNQHMEAIFLNKEGLVAKSIQLEVNLPSTILVQGLKQDDKKREGDYALEVYSLY